MPVNFVYKTKSDKASHDSMMEFVRLKDGQYLFDEIHVRSINFKNLGSEAGVEIFFNYERFGTKVQDLRPLEATLREFSEARQIKENGGDFAESNLVKRLFSWACAEYNQKSAAVQTDIVAELDFVAKMGNE